jgi:Amt family ammonium transporter
MKNKFWLPLLGVFLIMTSGLALGQEAEVMEAVEEVAAEASATDILAYAVDNLFLLLYAVLVIFMQAGFAILESGLNHSKNTVNILMKNVMDFCLGVILYFFIGYGIMYPGEFNGYFGYAGVAGADNPAIEDAVGGTLHVQVDFHYRLRRGCGTHEIRSLHDLHRHSDRYHLSDFRLLEMGGGWLDTMGFYDFAGSILVHAVGGFAGLAGAIVLGPRIGRFGKDKTAMPGHNLTFAALGVFILLIGWFGFNPGSQLAIASYDDQNAVMLIALNTTLAASAGAVFALILSWILDKKPDLTMALNGILAGLVGITALPDGVTNGEAIVIGAVAGLIVVGGIKLLEILKIDDPVGAFPVHGLCGLWGGIAVAIFGDYGDETGTWAAQLTGSLVIPVYAFITMFILFSILKAVGLLRVSEEDEMVGLDLSEHGQSAYGE